jgi:outer membrane protein assembly factor BamA
VRFYQVAQASIEFPHLANNRLKVGVQNLYRDALQVNFFGLGNDSLLSARSGYRLKYNDATTYAALGGPRLRLQARGGLLQPLSVGAMRGRNPRYPDTIALFDERDAPGISEQPSFVHGDLSLSVDTRDYPEHPTRGGFYAATATAFIDETAHRETFRRYEVEVSQFVPLHSPTLILALHGQAIASDASAGHSVPFYLMPNVGGRNLRGFRDYRFHDRSMQSYSVETRWRLFSHIDLAGFVDAGSVAPRVARLTFSDLKPSYGAGIRLHNDRTTMARFDAGHGAEGWHFHFKLNDPFRRSVQSNGWRSAAPFVP